MLNNMSLLSIKIMRERMKIRLSMVVPLLMESLRDLTVCLESHGGGMCL